MERPQVGPGPKRVALASGSLVSERNDFTVTAANMPPSAFGFFIVSPTQGFAATPGGSQGNLCLGGQIGRYAGDIFAADAGGTASLGIDLTAIPAVTTTFAVTPGTDLNFQAWHRDSVGGSAVSNFTRAVSVAFR